MCKSVNGNGYAQHRLHVSQWPHRLLVASTEVVERRKVLMRTCDFKFIVSLSFDKQDCTWMYTIYEVSIIRWFFYVVRSFTLRQLRRLSIHLSRECSVPQAILFIRHAWICAQRECSQMYCICCLCVLHIAGGALTRYTRLDCVLLHGRWLRNEGPAVHLYNHSKSTPRRLNISI